MSSASGAVLLIALLVVGVVVAWLVGRRAVKGDSAELKDVADSDVICPTCGERFLSESDLARHVAQYHPSS